jgi:hypothetical protein
MVIPDMRLSPVCSARANALRGQRRTADLIPDWLRVSTQLTFHRAGAIVKSCGSDLCVSPQRTSIGELQPWERVGRCSVQPNRKRGDDSVGACANCCGEQRPSLVVQDSVASAPRFDVGEQDDDEASLLDLGSDETNGGRHQGPVRAGQDP